MENMLPLLETVSESSWSISSGMRFMRSRMHMFMTKLMKSGEKEVPETMRCIQDNIWLLTPTFGVVKIEFLRS